MAWATVALLCIAGLYGCGYDKSSAAFMRPYEQGKFTAAASEATKLADSSHKHDRLVYRLEQGAILRAASQLQQSIQAFDQADELVEKYDQQADVQVSREAIAAVTNLTTLDYKGFCYDRIMMNTYKALNYMELGDVDKARVELFRAYDRQREAVDRYAKKIEADEKLKHDRSSKDGYDVARAEGDPKFQAGSKALYSDLPEMGAYGNYANPFCEYVQGIFFLSTASSADDLTRGRTAMRRVGGMVQGNEYVDEDVSLAEQVFNGQSMPPTTYVLFETGLAPVRQEVRIDIPLFAFSAARNARVDYVGANFPKLLRRPGGDLPATIRAGGREYPMTVLADMDRVIGQEFKNELPMVITRTLIAAGTKAAAAWAINESVRKQDALVQALVRLTTLGYQVAMNQADLRTWETLPKQIQLARFPTPPDRHIHILLPNGGQLPAVQLCDGVVNVVYIKSVTPAQMPVVRQFKLK